MKVCIHTAVAVEETSASQRKRWRRRLKGDNSKKKRKQRKTSTEEWLFAVIHVPSVFMSHGHYTERLNW